MTTKTYESLTEGKYEYVRIFENTYSHFKPSYVGYFLNDKTKVLNIQGFPARQIEELHLEDEMDSHTYSFDVEIRHSKKFDTNYLVISKMVRHPIKDFIQNTLKVEDESV